jgi:hypothetical protein
VTARSLRREASSAWEAYRHAAVVGLPGWDCMRLRHAWERLVVRAALAELAEDGDPEAARRLAMETK